MDFLHRQYKQMSFLPVPASGRANSSGHVNRSYYFNSFFFKSRWDGLEGSLRKYDLCVRKKGLRNVPDSDGMVLLIPKNYLQKNSWKQSNETIFLINSKNLLSSYCIAHCMCLRYAT